MFESEKNKGIYWALPISSQVEKYMEWYEKISRNGKPCDRFAFAKVQGNMRAFVVQNICPVSPKDIADVYKDKKGCMIRLDHRSADRIEEKARRILCLARQGIFLTATDPYRLEHKLLLQLQREQERTKGQTSGCDRKN